VGGNPPSILVKITNGTTPVTRVATVAGGGLRCLALRAVSGYDPGLGRNG
jgi:hypothetical protein